MSIQVRVDLTTAEGDVLRGFIVVGAGDTLYGILSQDSDHIDWISLNGGHRRLSKTAIRNLRLISSETMASGA